MSLEIWNKKLNLSIDNLITEYRNNTKSLLTEGDLENLLYYHCKKNGLPIHSQITWFKDSRKSGYEVDLTILDEQKLYVEKFDEYDKLYYNFEYPHKGYFYDGKIIGIELKFVRKNEDLKKKILCDLKKLNEKIIPHKKTNIDNGVYKISNLTNVKFQILIGFKEETLLLLAKKHIEKYIQENLDLQEMLQICLFCPTKTEKLSW